MDQATIEPRLAQAEQCVTLDKERRLSATNDKLLFDLFPAPPSESFEIHGQ